MPTRTHRARRTAALTIIAALTLAACGSDDPDAVTGSAPVTDDSTSGADGESTTDDGGMDDADDSAMDDMDDMDGMNMGDPDATPAGDVEGAALARGELELLDTRPEGYDDLTGTAVIARHPNGTTVTVRLDGLVPNVDYISHLHAQACADENGGPHYQFVVGGPEVPPNEIHLAFTSDADGNGFMTAENDAVAGADAVALVVHPREFVDNKIACVDFVPDDPDAVAAAIEAGPAFDASSADAMDDTEMDSTEMDDMEMDDGAGGSGTEEQEDDDS